MSNVRDEFGNPVYQTDEYGNPIYQTDQYGNPIQTQAYTAGTGTGTGGGDYGHGTAPTATGYGGGEPVMGATVGGQTQAQPIRTEREHHEGLQRSKSSSSSSSSEDDGQGGRRRKKKGLKEKVKEKIPGMGHKKEEGHHTGTGATATTTGTTTASTGTTAYGHEQQHPGEKKGIMEKIKEKLPGGGGHH